VLKVTEAAFELLAELLTELLVPEGDVVRVVAGGEGLSLVMGQIQADDRASGTKARRFLLSLKACLKEVITERWTLPQQCAAST
jgi:hypothetical protein